MAFKIKILLIFALMNMMSLQNDSKNIKQILKIVKRIENCLSCAPEPPPPGPEMALLVSGGYPNPKTVEVILNDGTSLCSLQSSSELPYSGRGYHTMDGGIICGGVEAPKNCSKFETGNWNPYSSEMIYDYVGHVSWNRFGDYEAIQLFGGANNNWRQSEIISATESSPSPYQLPIATRMACSIQFPDQVVVTGGIYTTNRVMVYGAENFISYLPELLVGRYDHGCTSFYNEDEELVYIVSGGRNDVEYLQSTEFYKFGQAAWALAGDLPSVRAGLRGGNLNNNVFMTGGTNSDGTLDEILMLNKKTLMWQYMNQMNEKRFAHAVSTVKLEDFQQFCQ